MLNLVSSRWSIPEDEDEDDVTVGLVARGLL